MRPRSRFTGRRAAYAPQKRHERTWGHSSSPVPVAEGKIRSPPATSARVVLGVPVKAAGSSHDRRDTVDRTPRAAAGTPRLRGQASGASRTVTGSAGRRPLPQRRVPGSSSAGRRWRSLARETACCGRPRCASSGGSTSRRGTPACGSRRASHRRPNPRGGTARGPGSDAWERIRGSRESHKRLKGSAIALTCTNGSYRVPPPEPVNAGSKIHPRGAAVPLHRHC
jgi:hypothetical protein